MAMGEGLRGIWGMRTRRDEKCGILKTDGSESLDEDRILRRMETKAQMKMQILRQMETKAQMKMWMWQTQKIQKLQKMRIQMKQQIDNVEQKIQM